VKQKSTPRLTGNSDVQRRQFREVIREHITCLMTLGTSDILLDLLFEFPLADSTLQGASPRVLELGWILVDEKFEDGIRLELWIILKQQLDFRPELVEWSCSRWLLARLFRSLRGVLVHILSNRFQIHVAFLCTVSNVWFGIEKSSNLGLLPETDHDYPPWLEVKKS
jgi:hypothetical protein